MSGSRFIVLAASLCPNVSDSRWIVGLLVQVWISQAQVPRPSGGRLERHRHGAPLHTEPAIRGAAEDADRSGLGAPPAGLHAVVSDERVS
jgi:hypothetical protein